MTERNQSLQQHQVFDRASFTSLLESASFVIDEMTTAFVKPFTHQQMAACLKHHIIDEKILDGFYRLSEDFPDNGSELFAVCHRKP